MMELNSILNTSRYSNLRRMVDYIQDDYPLKRSLKSPYVIESCVLLQALLKDRKLWKQFEKPNYPLYPMRLRYTISGNMLKAIVTIHGKHMKTFLTVFKATYVRMFSFSKSGNKVKVVVLEEIANALPQTIDDLRLPLPGLQIIRPANVERTTVLPRSDELPPTTMPESFDILRRTPSRTTAEITTAVTRSEMETVELPSTYDEIFQIPYCIPPPRPVVEINREEHLNASRTFNEQILAQIMSEEIPIEQAIEIIEDVPPIRPMTEHELITVLDDEQSISYRRRYDPNFIEVVDDGAIETIQSVSRTTKSRATDSQRPDEIGETIDEVRKYLWESGIGVEGHEHIKTMEELQRVLNEEFSPRSRNIVTIQPPPRPVSPPSTSVIVVADVHHLPRHLRTPETREERVIDETSSLQVQVEVHAPPRSINYDEIVTVMESDQIQAPQAVEERPRDQFDLIIEQVEAVERVVGDTLTDHVEMLSREPEIRDMPIMEEITLGPIDVIAAIDEGRLIEDLQIQTIPEILTRTPEKSPIQHMVTEQQFVPDDTERQIVPELLAQVVESSVIESMITEPHFEPAVRPEEHIEALPKMSVRLPSVPLMQPEEPETYVVLQPDTRSERVETRSPPSASVPPRIRDLLEQESSSVRKTPKRTKKKKILYSNRVLRAKMNRRIRPQRYVSHQDSLILPYNQSVEYNEPFDDYDTEMKPIDVYRAPFNELPQNYDFFAQLFCDLFENDLDMMSDESAYELELNDLRASIAAPDPLLKVLRLSRRKSSRGDDLSKKSLPPIDHERQPSWREIPPIEMPPQIHDITLNLPNLGDTLVQTSYQGRESLVLPPGLVTAPDIPINITTTENRIIEEIAPIPEKEVQPEIVVAQRKRRRTRGEKVVSVPQTVVETEQRPPEELQSSVVQIGEPVITTVPVTVVQQEEENEEMPEPERRKTVTFLNVTKKLDDLWAKKFEPVTFCDLCPTEITKFEAASTFSALLCLHAMKIVVLEQEPQQWSPESLRIFRH